MPTDDVTQSADKIIDLLSVPDFETSQDLYRALDNEWRECLQLQGTTDESAPADGIPDVWRLVKESIFRRIQEREGGAHSMRPFHRTRTIVKLALEDLIAHYVDYHRNLLSRGYLEKNLNGFFMARCVEVVATRWDPKAERQPMLEAGVKQLNDYIGYRPVAKLPQSPGKPYDHEWVAPIPLFLHGVGAAVGQSQTVIHRAIEILSSTDEDILRAAHFHLDALTELCVDPRQYDFQSPISHRPNYLFGSWDFDSADSQGRYRRYVVQSVTLDAILSRINEADIDPEEVIEEAAAVLSGVMLMGSAVSGSGPRALGLSTDLGNLMDTIAAFRDQFYIRFFRTLTPRHQSRLQEEDHDASYRLSRVRHHLNLSLSVCGTNQVQGRRLAILYSQLGMPDSSALHLEKIKQPTTTLKCHAFQHLLECRKAVGAHEYANAIQNLQHAFRTVRDGIECGAFVDPWNIPGFGTDFYIFQGPGDSVYDERIDELVSVVTELFNVATEVWKKASAYGDQEVDNGQAVFEELVGWWSQFSPHQCESIAADNPTEVYDSARLVSNAVRNLDDNKISPQDPEYWTQFDEYFDSPTSYTSVIAELCNLSRHDAALSLLLHWIENASKVSIQSIPDSESFGPCAEDWLKGLLSSRHNSEASIDTSTIWQWIGRLFECLLADDQKLCAVPRCELDNDQEWDDESSQTAEFDDPLGAFDAAYEDLAFGDANDEEDDEEDLTQFQEVSIIVEETSAELARLSRQLDLLASIGRMFRQVTQLDLELSEPETHARSQMLADWTHQAALNREQLLKLSDSVERLATKSLNDQDIPLDDYDSLRLSLEAMKNRCIDTCLEMSDSRRVLTAKLCASRAPQAEDLLSAMSPDDQEVVLMLAALMSGNAEYISNSFERMISELTNMSLLYIPLSRGGNPREIITARLRRRLIARLLEWLPLQGHFELAFRLMNTARTMETQHPVGPGAVTEFDEIFAAAFASFLKTQIATFANWDSSPSLSDQMAILEKTSEAWLSTWLAHSRTLRLSALEKVQSARAWDQLIEFIQKYGRQLFPMSFIRLSGFRSILNQGVESWLTRLLDASGPMSGISLVQDLRDPLASMDLQTAAGHLEIILEALMDHFAEYRDYNRHTSHSDYGDRLYILLDFLRLMSAYNRVAWNLRPIALVHQCLCLTDNSELASQWLAALDTRIRSEAQGYLEKLNELQNQYAAVIPAIAGKIRQEFTAPMIVDRMQMNVRRILTSFDDPDAQTALETDVDLLSSKQLGSVIVVPDWLRAIESELANSEDPTSLQKKTHVPTVYLDEKAMNAQLDAIAASVSSSSDS